MASEADIFNMALSVLGRHRIQSITESTREARTLNAVWPLVRQTTLYNYAPRRAKHRWSLTQNDASPDSEWDYHYPIPTDCLRVLTVNEVNNEVASADIFEIENVGTGSGAQQVVATDLTSVSIQGVQDVTNMGLLDPGTHALLANELARHTANAFGLDPSSLRYLETVYNDTRADSRSSDGQEGSPKQIHCDILIKARE